MERRRRGQSRRSGRTTRGTDAHGNCASDIHSAEGFNYCASRQGSRTLIGEPMEEWRSRKFAAPPFRLRRDNAHKPIDPIARSNSLRGSTSFSPRNCLARPLQLARPHFPFRGDPVFAFVARRTSPLQKEFIGTAANLFLKTGDRKTAGRRIFAHFNNSQRFNRSNLLAPAFAIFSGFLCHGVLLAPP